MSMDASKRNLMLWTAAGALLYAGGIGSAALNHLHTAMAMRIAGLLLMAVAALRKRSLTGWIFFGMLAGVELGLDAPQAAISIKVLSDIFLRLIKVIVAPLIFGTLVTGIAGHGELRAVGRLGLKSIVYFEVLTTIALVIGLISINVSRAGAGLNTPAIPPSPTHSHSQVLINPEPEQPALSWQQFLLRIFPENIAKAVADNQILQVAVFAILFGLALGRLSEQNRAPMVRICESLTQTMFAFTNLVMYFAPIGVAAALAYTVAHSGLGVMLNLGKLLITLYAALAAFALLGMLPAALIARVPVGEFLRAVAEPATIAFATSTSEAALPRAIESMEAFGVPRKIVGFVIPTGYSFNLAGSALYLSLASLFVAQAAGIHMSLTQQIVMLGTLMLTSKGVAGVPRAVLVVLLATASIFGLPEEPIFVLLGVDALMDMGRTTVNVVGNCLAAAVVARWEGEFRTQGTSAQVLEALTD
ncbi:MAG: cation:dicarboxylase symporter family transporter [Silvibacterium sp.]|nr:cation:dicarboxylase symporter family transporter [Silvibacterium sp.]